MKTTKELARELGLLRQRRNAGNDRFSKKRPRSNCQQFSYLIILDYESTCWEQKKFQTQEIIEFPAVLLNTSTGVVESEFHYYVMPEEQPMLSAFCKQLTGITQEQVDNGIPLRLCLRKFSHWLDKLQREKGLVFDPPSEDSTEASYTTFVTWSDWDLGTCLLNECKRKQLLKPSQLNNWIDLRATYRKFYDRKPNGLNGALQDLGIEFEGREHSGIVDARNTATLAYRMMCDGCVMKITKSLNKGRKSQSLLTSNALVTKETRSPTKTPSSKRRKLTNEERDDDIIMATPDKNSDSCIKPILRRSPPNWSKMQNKVVSPVRKSPRDSKKTQNNAGRSAVRRSPRLMKHSKEVRTVNSATNVSTPRKHIVSKGFSAKQIYVDSNSLQAKSGLETCIGNGGLTNRDRNATETRQNCDKRPNQNKTGDVNSCNKFKNPDIELGVRFKVPSPNTCIQTSFCKKSPMNISNSFMNSTNSILKTPDINTSTSMKATPPMCKCGRRSKRRMVQSPGPNLGRFFFSCSGVKSIDRNGCGFFKWESSIQSSGSSGRHQSFVSKYNLSCLSKPFTPVFQQGGGCNSSAPQKRSLGVRPSANRSCIR